jgi:hypothetical protein
MVVDVVDVVIVPSVVEPNLLPFNGEAKEKKSNIKVCWFCG